MTIAIEAFAQFLREREVASLDYVRGQGDSFLALTATDGAASFFPPGGGFVEGVTDVNGKRPPNPP